MTTPPADRLLAAGEVARLLCLDRKTIARMADRGVLPALKTLGGHRRFNESDVLALVRESMRAFHEQPARPRAKRDDQRPVVTPPSDVRLDRSSAS